MNLHFPWTYDAERKTVLDHRGTPILDCVFWPDSVGEVFDLFEKAAAVGRLAAASGDLQAAARELVKVIDGPLGACDLPADAKAMADLLDVLGGHIRAALEPELTGLRAALAKAEDGR